MDPSRAEASGFKVGVRQKTGGDYQTIVEVETQSGFECFIMKIRLDGEELSQNELALLHDYTTDSLVHPEDIQEAHAKMKAIAHHVQKIFHRKMPSVGRGTSSGIIFSASRLSDPSGSLSSIQAAFTKYLGVGKVGTQEKEESILVKQSAKSLYLALHATTRKSVREARGRRLAMGALKPPSFASFSDEETSKSQVGIPGLHLGDEADDSVSQAAFHEAALGVSHSLSQLLTKIETDSVYQDIESQSISSSSKHSIHQAAAKMSEALSKMLVCLPSSSDSEEEKEAVGGAKDLTEMPLHRRKEIQKWVNDVQSSSVSRRSSENALEEGLVQFQESMGGVFEREVEQSQRSESPISRLSIDLQNSFQSLGLAPELTHSAAQAMQMSDTVDRGIADVAVQACLQQQSDIFFDAHSQLSASEDAGSEVYLSATDLQEETAETEKPSATGVASTQPKTGRDTFMLIAKTFIRMESLQEFIEENLQPVPSNPLAAVPSVSFQTNSEEWGKYIGKSIQSSLNDGQTPQVILAEENIDMNSDSTKGFLKQIFRSFGQKKGYVLASTGPSGEQGIYLLQIGMSVLGVGGKSTLTAVSKMPSDSKIPVLLLSDSQNSQSTNFPAYTSRPFAQYWVSTGKTISPRQENLVTGITQAKSSGGASYALGSKDAAFLMRAAKQQKVAELMLETSAASSSTIASLLLGAVDLLKAQKGADVQQQAKNLASSPASHQMDLGKKNALQAELQSLLMVHIGKPGEDILIPTSSTPALMETLQQLRPREGDIVAAQDLVQNFIWPLVVGHATAASVSLRYLQR